jgi:pimeloyl-[acyl-carrier protein] methyl ester esterase
MKSKPTLALLHGWGMNPRVFDGMVAQLNEHVTLLPLALPGHGGTEILTTNTLATWAAQLSTQLPEQTMLLGWSLGGQVAMRIALDHPAQIQRLILVSSTPKFVLDDNWQAGIPLADIMSFGEDMQRDTRATLLRFLTLQTRGSSAQKVLLESLRKTFFATPLPAPLALSAGLDTLLHTDLRTDVATLNQPTLVIHGSLDKLTLPSAGAWLAETIPHAKYCLIDGAAHAPFLSHPQQVAEAILEEVHD